MIYRLISGIILKIHRRSLRDALSTRERLLDLSRAIKQDSGLLSAFLEDDGYWQDRLSGWALDMDAAATKIYVSAVDRACGPFKAWGRAETCFDVVYLGGIQQHKSFVNKQRFNRG